MQVQVEGDGRSKGSGLGGRWGRVRIVMALLVGTWRFRADEAWRRVRWVP